jgi:hypothetical protein
MSWSRRTFVLTASLVLPSCAGARRTPENAAAARVPDSVPERAAAQRAATPGLEAEEDRWGIEAARERKRQREPKPTAVKPAPPSGNAAVGVTPDAR